MKKWLLALLYLIVIFLVVIIVFKPSARSEALQNTERTTCRCNFTVLVEPENQAASTSHPDNKCPPDKPLLEVRMRAYFKGNCSFCRDATGQLIPCNTCPEGYGNVSLGPGLTSQCVASP